MAKLMLWALITAPGHFGRKFAIWFLSSPVLETAVFLSINPVPVLAAIIRILESPSLRMSLSIWARLTPDRDVRKILVGGRRDWLVKIKEIIREVEDDC
jgi:hypothetical protein